MCEKVTDGSTPFIIGGDFNIALNGSIDTVNYISENNTRARDVLLGGRPLITLRMVGGGGVSTERNDGVTWGRGWFQYTVTLQKPPLK